MRISIAGVLFPFFVACTSEPIGPEPPPPLPTPNECLATGCSFEPLVVANVPPFAKMTASSFESCGITDGGDVMCWGLVDGMARTPPTEVQSNVTLGDVSSGRTHHCGLTGAGSAYCWGFNDAGELGIGSATPAEFTPAPVVGGLTFVEVVAGFRHSCGITDDREVYCWGLNLLGELGVDSTSRLCLTSGIPCTTTPVRVQTDLRFAALTAGSFYTCGVTTDSEAFCWGDNIESETTSSSGGPELRPVDSTLRFASLSGGANHACGLTDDGAAYCWGNSAALDGALGNATDNVGAVQVSGGIVFTELVSGEVHNCGLTAAGEAFCWGSNRAGQLAAFTTDVCFFFTCSRVPIAVMGDLRFTSLAAGGSHTCGATPEGTTYCWGSDTVGQLGKPTTSAAPSTKTALGPLRRHLRT